MPGLNFLSIYEARGEIQRGNLDPRDLVKACLDEIERLNPALRAFITVQTPEAEEQTVESNGSDAGPKVFTGSLRGIPLAIKDLFETKGIRTTAGSLFFKDYVPTDDAAAVSRLKHAGAVILGKTNTHEIALGVTSVNPHFGACRNPWDTSRISGGSSGGSAVAVAAGMALGGFGTDTGGSVRIPASLCGVVGLKPTYGRISVRGVVPLSWNLDHVGTLTRTVRDAAILLQVLAGYDAEDPYSIDEPVADYAARIEEGVQGGHVAFAVGAYADDTDPDVKEAVRQAALVFETLGAKVDSVDVSFLREAALANSVMVPADGAAYHRQRLDEHPEWFGADVRQRLETGRGFSSTEYSLARHTQHEMKRRLGGFFGDYDLLILPATPNTAPMIEGSDAVEQARRLTRYTAPFNLTGLPAISVPCGFDRQGLPIGLQLVSRAWDEAGLLRAAHAYERETGWCERHPSI